MRWRAQPAGRWWELSLQTSFLLREKGGRNPGRYVREYRWWWWWLRDHAVHLEHLGVLAVHVDAVRPGQVAHVLLVRIAAVLLWGVLVECGDLAVDMPLFERDIP